MNALAEAGVKSTKVILKNTVAVHVMTYEKFSMAQIEMVLNSRPLVPTSNREDDFGYLTAGHF